MSDNPFQSLMDSVRKQTAAVEGSMAKIDEKVALATEAVPDQIKKSMYVQCYVDAINGNDSNSGVSRSTAKRTIR
ncbi:hypothetical protein, partial [Photobacterium carnosum]|uniref:hypothetical protein n=1 Tax=Photobacterium carnosum TaxID=2023717 RepID=UPI001E557099